MCPQSVKNLQFHLTPKIHVCSTTPWFFPMWYHGSDLLLFALATLCIYLRLIYLYHCQHQYLLFPFYFVSVFYVLILCYLSDSYIAVHSSCPIMCCKMVFPLVTVANLNVSLPNPTSVASVTRRIYVSSPDRMVAPPSTDIGICLALSLVSLARTCTCIAVSCWCLHCVTPTIWCGTSPSVLPHICWFFLINLIKVPILPFWCGWSEIDKNSLWLN